MFIRFKLRKLSTKRKNVLAHYCLHASLVESYRRNGRPRQRMVLYLGAIRLDALANRKSRVKFWKEAFERISRLNHLPSVKARLKLAFTDRLMAEQKKLFGRAPFLAAQKRKL